MEEHKNSGEREVTLKDLELYHRELEEGRKVKVRKKNTHLTPKKKKRK